MPFDLVSQPSATAPKMDSEIVKVTVSGRLYDVPRALIERPLKLQAFRTEKSPSGSGETLYRFARHLGCFEAALDYLNSQELHMPQDVCPQVFVREMGFWGVDVNELKNCCKVRLDIFLQEMKALNALNKDDTPSTTNKGTWRSFFHQSLEEPKYSLFGQVYFWVAMGFVLLSIFALCAETMPVFRGKLSRLEWKEFLGREYHDYEDLLDLEKGDGSHEEEDDAPPDCRENETSRPRLERKLPENHGSLNPNIYYLSLVCGAFFTVDIVFRFSVFIGRKRFFLSLLNIVDAVAVLAFFLREVLLSVFPRLMYTESYVDVIVAISAIRVFRIFRLVGQSSGLRVFLFSLRAGIREIWLLILFMLIGMLVFSSLLYFCERPDNVISIPHAFWWSIITMTTVGYGDMVPKTGPGQLVGSLCAISGVLVMAVTVPIFASKFALYYHRVGSCRSVAGSGYKPFRRYSSFVKPMPQYGSQKMTTVS